MATPDPTQAIATGNDATMRASSRFVIEIRYREPSYEVQHGARSEPYRFRYRIDAPSEQAAVALVVAEFEGMNVLSSVGWTRLIVAIVVEPVIEAPSSMSDLTCSSVLETTRTSEMAVATSKKTDSKEK